MFEMELIESLIVMLLFSYVLERITAHALMAVMLELELGKRRRERRKRRKR